MPKRNPVPTLKVLCIRQLAWPKDLLTSGTTKSSAQDLRLKTPSRVTISSTISALFSCQGRRDKPGKEQLPKSLTEALESVPGLNDAIVNAWIKISNFYGTRIDRLKQMNKYLKCSVSTLDFVQEGFTLRDGTEFEDIAGVLPVTSKSQVVYPEDWLEIYKVLQATRNAKTLQALYIHFGLRKDASMSEFKFQDTFSQLKGLTKLVISGSVDDQLMKIIGSTCECLRWLDLRGCGKVSTNGILLLLFSRIIDNGVLRAAGLIILERARRPLTYTLQYFDMSAIPCTIGSVKLSKIVPAACSHLKATPSNLFFAPAGVFRFRYHFENKSMDNIRMQIELHSKAKYINIILRFIEMLRSCFQFGVTEVELRADATTGRECGIIFLQAHMIIASLTLDNLTAITLTTYAASSFDFISLETLAIATPCLRQIKAPLKGVLSSERNLFDLRSVTAPMLHSKETLISVVKFSFELEYLEVREIFLSEELCDDDLHEMTLSGPYPCMEVFRLLFPNHITLVPGVKDLMISCPSLKVFGDLKLWSAITMDTKLRFIQNISKHNFELLIECDGILYPTNSPCKELQR